METIKVHLTDAAKRRLAGFMHADVDCEVPVQPPYLQRNRNSAWLKAIVRKERRPAILAAAVESLEMTIGKEASDEFRESLLPKEDKPEARRFAVATFAELTEPNPVAALSDDEALVYILGVDPCPTYYVGPYTPEELKEVRELNKTDFFQACITMWKKGAGLKRWANVSDQNGEDVPYDRANLDSMRTREAEVYFISSEIMRFTKGLTPEEMQGLGS